MFAKQSSLPIQDVTGNHIFILYLIISYEPYK